MITSLLITFLATILNWAFGWLPKVTVMPEWYTPVQNALGIFSALGQLPIIGTPLQIALLILTMLAGWQVVQFANWLYNKIRGSG